MSLLWYIAVAKVHPGFRGQFSHLTKGKRKTSQQLALKRNRAHPTCQQFVTLQMR